MSFAIAALLAGGGAWFAWSAWRPDQLASRKSNGADVKTISDNGDTSREQPAEITGRGEPKVSSSGGRKAGQMPSPPELNRRFKDFTPEQRVEFARQGHGPGG
jgi:hypothetical protein